jgi:hypothetical protein
LVLVFLSIAINRLFTGTTFFLKVLVQTISTGAGNAPDRIWTANVVVPFAYNRINNISLMGTLFCEIRFNISQKCSDELS